MRWDACATRGRRDGARRARDGCWRWPDARAGASPRCTSGPVERRPPADWKRELDVELGEGDAELFREVGRLLPGGGHHRAGGRRHRAPGAAGRRATAGGAPAAARGDGRGRQAPAGEAGQGSRGADREEGRLQAQGPGPVGGHRRRPAPLQEAHEPAGRGAAQGSLRRQHAPACSRSWRSSRSTWRPASSSPRTWSCSWAGRARRSSWSSPTPCRSAICGRRCATWRTRWGNGAHGLQLLGAVASVVRGLLENQDRLDRLAHGSAPRSYDEFKNRVWPAVEKEAKESKGKAPHPYGAFLGMQAAGRYGRSGLLRSPARVRRGGPLAQVLRLRKAGAGAAAVDGLRRGLMQRVRAPGLVAVRVAPMLAPHPNEESS